MPINKSGDNRRVPRVEKELQGLISQYISSMYKGEIQGLLTINHVRVAGDLRSAQVHVSLLGGTEIDAKKAVAILQKHAVDIQSYVHERLPMKYCPKLSFLIDKGLDKVLKVEALLHEIEQQRLGPAVVGTKNVGSKKKTES
jgi:ribosome-binding factor A